MEDRSTWKNNGSATSTIRKHLQRYHETEWVNTVQHKKLKGHIEPHEQHNGTGGDSPAQEAPFTVAGFYERLIRWIIVDDQASVFSSSDAFILNLPL